MRRSRILGALIIGTMCGVLSSASAAEKAQDTSKEKKAKAPATSSTQTTATNGTATPQTTTTQASPTTATPVRVATPAPAAAEQQVEGVVKSLEIKPTTATVVVKQPDGTEWAVTADPALSLVQQDGKIASLSTLRVGGNVRVHYTVKNGQPVIRVVDVLPYKSVTGAVVSTTSR